MTLMAPLLALLLTAGPPPSPEPLGRYARAHNGPTPEQVDPLSVSVWLRFPARIVTVGDAVEHALARSGFRLAPGAVRDSEVAALLALPLPEVHRELGPLSLADALTTLGRPAYRLVVDPVRRWVAFEIHPTFRGDSRE